MSDRETLLLEARFRQLADALHRQHGGFESSRIPLNRTLSDGLLAAGLSPNLRNRHRIQELLATRHQVFRFRCCGQYVLRAAGAKQRETLARNAEMHRQRRLRKAQETTT